MSFDPLTCKIVKSSANGKEFLYCRTHQCEAEENEHGWVCPGPSPKEDEKYAPDDVCMCGDSMKNHDSPLSCGHVPVSMADYYSYDPTTIRKKK